jgi:E2F/DP family winged-helix DNA-binding domain
LNPPGRDTVKRKSEHNFIVTPTPTKKQHTTADYSRKNKSLGLLCDSFIARDWHDGILSIDSAAKELQVERRRIYDIVNILECLQVVAKLHKNTYQWKGLLGLEPMMGRLQEEALLEFPDLAFKFGLLTEPSQARDPLEADAKKSLGKLARLFLQLFLVGHPSLSLHEASDLILGVSTMEDLSRIGGLGTVSSPKSIKAAATKGLKTKIRRLYDIANILCSLGLVRKLDGHRSKHVFVWAYPKSVQDILAAHQEHGTPHMMSPETHEASRVLVNMMPQSDNALPRTVTLESGTSLPTPTKHNLANIHELGARETPLFVRSVSMHPDKSLS